MSVLRESCPVQSRPVPFLSPDVTVLMLGKDPTQVNRQGRQVVNNCLKKATYLRQPGGKWRSQKRTAGISHGR